MLSTQKKRQQKRKLLSQLEDFEDFFIGDEVSGEQQIVVINDSLAD